MKNSFSVKYIENGGSYHHGVNGAEYETVHGLSIGTTTFNLG